LHEFNLSNCRHRHTASPAQEEETDLLLATWLVAAGLDTLIRSQPALADECRPSLEEFRQVLARMLA